MRRNIPEKTQFLGKKIDRFPDHEIKTHIATGNNGHLFLAFNESTKSKLAFKIIPVDNLLNGYLNEAKKPNSLENPSVVKCHDVVKYPDSKLNCIVFIYDYVEGENLRDYMKEKRSNIDIPFIENFLKTMFGLLYELDRRESQHGDLHPGNILVAHSAYDLSRKKTFRVTDFGVGELIGQDAHANDYLNVANTLRKLLGCVKYGECEGRDRYIYNILKNDFLGRHLFETDTSADPLACNPWGLNNKLEKLDAEWRDQKQPDQDKLETPFDYPNCEQIGNSHLLLKSLYSDRLLGLSEIQEKANLMLTGPRGCGKTTVFRALSLEYLISTHESSPSDLKYIGIYYRCDYLYFSFPRYKHPERTEALDIPMHFLIVTLLAATLEQIGAWAKEYFSDQLAKEEEALVSELWNIFEWDAPDAPSGNQLTTLVNRLRKESKRAVNKQQVAHVAAEPIQGYFGPGIMLQACAFIRKKFTCLENRPFYFFIDDYSAPKITKELQANLNRLVMHRSPDVFFKLSTESPVSFVRYDIDGKQFVEKREYVLLNLGLRYIKDDSNDTLAFLEDLFKRRFAEVSGYPVETLEELLGSRPRNENDTARAFLDKEKRNYYAGQDTVAAMCSGDIHYMIRLVARMVEENGGKESLTDCDTIPKISMEKQNESIRAAAGDFMESIRTLPKTGPILTEVITAFGNVAHSYLMHAVSRNEGKENPHQASRIEPYEGLNLSTEAEDILEELLRYSVLIEDPRGKSRRGEVVSRFYLRRYIIPHFRLTFSKRDSIQLENSQIEMLLRDPKKFKNRMMLKLKRHFSQKDLFEL